jgi:tetratricopeptide (TPR) repeat protein
MHHSLTLRRTAFLALSLLSACAAGVPGSGADPSAPVTPRTSADPTAGNAGDYLVGRFAATQNDLPYAAREFAAALAREPGDPELQQQAFLASLLSGSPAALGFAKSQPDNQAAQLLLADADAKAGRWSEAEARYAALPHDGMSQVLQPMLVAWAQQGEGHTDAALATLKPFLEGQRFRAVYTLHAALIADLGGNSTEAARLYKRAQADYGSLNLQLGRMIASWQARQGDVDDARQTLKSMIDTSPDVAIALPALRQDVAQRQVRNATDGLAEAYLALAAALRSQDSNEFALVLLQLALDVRPDLTAGRLLLADIMDARGHADAALAALAPIHDSDPLAGVIRLRRAALTQRAGDADAALRMLTQIAHDYPDRSEPPSMEGDILRIKRRFADAAVAYDHAIALMGPPMPGSWPLFYDRGVALERSHQWPRAEADFLKALELSPDQPMVLNYLGYSWADQSRNLPRARTMIERAAEERPNDGAILDSLGWVILRQGDVTKAVQFLERATELEPEDAAINGHLGDAYWAAGRKLEAEFQWRRSLNLNPEPEDVPKLQAKLRDSEQALHMPMQPVQKAVQ